MRLVRMRVAVPYSLFHQFFSLLLERREKPFLPPDAFGGEFFVGGAGLGSGLFRQFEKVGADGGDLFVEFG
jgi:hypothetical protein